jgi:hypothetical protein
MTAADRPRHKRRWAIMPLMVVDPVKEAARARLGERARPAPAPGEDRLGRLAREVREGSYAVPAALVAEAMVETLLTGPDRARRRG